MLKKDFKILYVDDEQQNLISFKATFRREYKIFTAINGREGIEILRNNNINLIISDQRMPEMTGVQFFEKIIPEFPDSIRMILTGFSDVTAIIDAINNGGVFRYITKPWDETEFRMTIENARQLYKLQQSSYTLLFELQQKVEEQEKILKLFMKYVPEPVVQKALNESDESIFDGELKNTAILFSDIRGFTPMSEEMNPREVVSFLNHYYSIMTICVKRHKGTVNQFVGDEILAVFGAPLSFENNELNSVFCALEMMEKLSELNEIYQEKIGMEIKMGIGINYGEVIAGNLGSEDKIDYSVTGDTVNTGKRIETITKEYPNTILISESIYKETKEHINTKEWEPLYVKGKKAKILVYEVINRK
jgi:class 3 adenylate cyclase/CheY-like chemotaxis protein